MKLLKRCASALVGGGVVFAVLYLGARFDIQWIAGLLILAVGYPAAVEYLQLMKRLDIELAAPEFLIWIPIMVFSYLAFGGRYAEVVLLLAIAYQVLRHLGDTPHRQGLFHAAAGVFGLLYIPWLLHYFYLIYTGGAGHSPHVGAVNALVVLLMVWGFDSGAYLIGSTIGRHKAFPSISPSKTWEGVAGGFIFAAAGGMIGASLSPFWRSFIFWGGFPHFLLSVFFVGWAVQLGDIFASKMKRAADVKDSGTFLPGHGGAIDRIDGLLFALPVFYFYYHYILNVL
ncbi:MAG: phosphatidate cytidylyltransferase [Candidatus Bipolaricaulia bacterium]